VSRWFRFYDRALDDPKVQRLPPDVFKGWVNLLCLASRNVTRNGERNGGVLPPLSDIAFALRISEREADGLMAALMAAGLLDDGPDGITPHKWNDLQFQSDKDPTNADRQRRFRERKLEKKHNDGVTRYASVTKRSPDTDTDTDTETDTEKKEEKIKGTCASARAPRALLRAEFSTVLSDEMADAVIEHRQRMRRALTPKAAALLAKQFGKCPDPNAAAAMMLERGWQGFNAEWMTREKTNGQGRTEKSDFKAEWRATLDAINGRRTLRREEGALEGDYRVVGDGGV
jgi:hypothetical protein